MYGRCAVETLAEFGFWAAPKTSGIALDSEAHAFIYNGSNEVFVFDLKEKILTGILQFPTSVSDLVQSEDKQHLYVACRCAVYCIHLPPILSRFSTAQSSSPAEVKLSSEDIVIQAEGVLCLLVVGTVLVALSRSKESWIFTVNKPRENGGVYEILNSFCLPNISYEAEERKPVMNYVCLRESSFSSENHLEPTLFKHLFGIDSALIKSPIVLCGLPDGRLCFLSLRLSGIHVFHSLEEPVVFVGATVVIETDAGGPYARRLVAVGERGRVLAIKMCEKATEEGAMKVSFTEGCVQGPVTCACADKNRLYLSTGSDLLSLWLTEETDGKPDDHRNLERTTTQNTNSLQIPISLNVCRITAFTTSTSSAAGQIKLFSLSNKGQLQQIILPEAGVNGALNTTALKTPGGKSMKDLLSAIGDVCERASGVKASLKSKNKILQHLNQALNVCFLLLSPTDAAQQPIRIHAATKWTRLLQEDALHLTCVLENHSSYSLERGWLLNITVHPLSQEQSTSTNYSFPFCNLSPGQKFEATLPLTAGHDTLFPITISCALVFSLGTYLDEKHLQSLLTEQNNIISLPLNSLTIDWLHTLQLSTSANDQYLKSDVQAKTSDTLRAFLKSKGKERVNKGESKTYSACIKASSDLLRETLVSNGDIKDSASVCVTFLDWLLSEPHRGVTAQPRENFKHNGILLSHGPNGHVIKLVAKEENVGFEEESVAVVEVQVESSSLSAVCGLHHAILDRILILMKNAPTKSSSVKEESLGLRAALLRAEHLLQQIHDSRVSGAFASSSAPMTQSLVNIYKELRERPLIIL